MNILRNQIVKTNDLDEEASFLSKLIETKEKSEENKKNGAKPDVNTSEEIDKNEEVNDAKTVIAEKEEESEESSS